MNLKLYLSTAADMYIKNYQIKTASFQLGRIRYCKSSVKPSTYSMHVGVWGGGGGLDSIEREGFFIFSETRCFSAF